MNKEALRRLIKKKKKPVDSFIVQALKFIESGNLRQACRHIFRGGKRMRPALTLFTTEAVGGDAKKAIPIASAIEIMSGFSLIHDDIIDKDEMRRRLPTVHKQWGEAVAILAGDTLLSLSLDIIAAAEGAKKIKLEISRLCAQTVIKMCVGEFYDIALQRGQISPTEKNYLKMVEGKTASLFKAASMAGALICNANQKRVKKFGEFGRFVGIAFQIKDDVLGIMSNEILGKPVGSDIREGKITLPMIHFNNNCTNQQKRLFNRFFGKSIVEADVNRIRELFTNVGSISYAEAYGRKYIRKALQILSNLNLDSKYYDILSTFANLAVEREY